MRRILNLPEAGSATQFGADDTDFINKYLTGFDQSATDPVYITTTTSYKTQKFRIRGSDDGVGPFYYAFQSGPIQNDYNLILPTLSGADDTLAVLNLAQIFKGKTLDLAGSSPINIITQTGATTGDVLTFNGTKFLAAAPTGGGGGSGEINTGTNLGTLGTGVYDSKTSTVLGFRNIAAGSNKVTVTYDATNKNILVNVSEPNLNLNNMAGTINKTVLPSDTVYYNDAATITNKTIDQINNIIALRLYDAMIFKSDTTYYARRSDGTLISSSTVPENVIQSALNITGNIIISSGIYDMSPTFTGLTIPSGTFLLGMNTWFGVPNAYTGSCFIVNSAWFGGLQRIQTYEQGTPTRGYTGLLMDANGGSQFIGFFKVADMYFYQCNEGIRLRANTAGGWVNANYFQNILVDDSHIGVVYEAGAGDINSNFFEMYQIESGGTGITTNGFKDIRGNRTTFNHCYCFDFEPTANEANLTASAAKIVILGGQMTGAAGTFTDSSTAADTIIIDGSTGFKIGNKSTFANYLDIKAISTPGNPATGYGRFYVKTVDSNNDGVFTKIKKSGAFAEVQVI